MSSQICPSCSSANAADAQFCGDCGAILVRSGGSPKPSPFEVEPIPPPGASGGPALPGPPPKNRFGIGAALFVLIVLVMLGLFFFGNRESEQIPVPGESPAETPAEEPTEAPAPTEPPRARREPTSRPAPPPPDIREADNVHELEPEPPPEREPRERAREPEPPREPERPAEPERPREPERRREPERQLPSVQGDERGRPSRAGWYRVKFRAPLFQSPSETAPIITYLRPGTRIRVTHVVPGFLAVQSTTGKAPGFVSTDDAEPEGSADR